jgi:hypothetical protein
MALSDKSDPNAELDLDVSNDAEMSSNMDAMQNSVFAQMKTNTRLRTRMLKLAEEGDKYGYFDHEGGRGV